MTIIPATQEVEIGILLFEISSGQKVLSKVSLKSYLEINQKQKD
jgi:hypothetical protein